jgi:hypothetical protein
MPELLHLYDVQKLKSAEGEEDSWLISEKQQSDNYIGVISFAAGKVRRVARFHKWTQDDDSVELAHRFCDLMEKLTRDRGSQANIVARTTDGGKISVRGVELVFGDKRVSVNVISRNDADSKQTEVHLDGVVQDEQLADASMAPIRALQLFSLSENSAPPPKLKIVAARDNRPNLTLVETI